MDSKVSIPKRFQQVKKTFFSFEWGCIPAYLLPKDWGEELIGDYRETINGLRKKGKGTFTLFLVALGKFIHLMWALIKIRYEDLKPKSKRN